MTVAASLTRLAEKLGVPLHAEVRSARPGHRQHYMFCLEDGTEYASATSLQHGRYELVRLMKLYGPTLSQGERGFSTREELRQHLTSLGAPELFSEYERFYANRGRS